MPDLNKLFVEYLNTAYFLSNSTSERVITTFLKFLLKPLIFGHPKLHEDLDKTVTYVQTPLGTNVAVPFVSFEPASLEAIGNNHTVSVFHTSPFLN